MLAYPAHQMIDMGKISRIPRKYTHTMNNDFNMSIKGLSLIACDYNRIAEKI
jgi:hypothetical protein